MILACTAEITQNINGICRNINGIFKNITGIPENINDILTFVCTHVGFCPQLRRVGTAVQAK